MTPRIRCENEAGHDTCFGLPVPSWSPIFLPTRQARLTAGHNTTVVLQAYHPEGCHSERSEAWSSKLLRDLSVGRNRRNYRNSIQLLRHRNLGLTQHVLD